MTAQPKGTSPVFLPLEFTLDDGMEGAVPSWPADSPALWSVDASLVGDRAQRLAPDVLDSEERGRAARFVAEADRRCYVASHVALRVLLGERLGLAPREVRFFREPCPGCGAPHGRPATDGGVHFSLSHSHDVALLGFADVPLGVDVEALPRARSVAEVGATLHPVETGELDRLPEEQRPVAFARAWTRKEAFLKGEGIGLARDLSLDYVGTGPVPPPGPEGWSIGDVRVPAGYAGAVAVRTAGHRPATPAHPGR